MDLADHSARPKTSSGVTGTLALAMLLASLGTSIANIALPVLAEAFEAPFSQVQAVVVAYLAGLTICVVIAGRLGDLYGLKRVLVAGTGVFLAASLLCSVVPNLWFLIAARTIQGAGAGFMMTLSMALMRETADDKHVGRAMGLLGTMSALGTALGPSVGGLLISAAGWRGIFWLQVPLAALALVLAYTMVSADAPPAKKRRPSFWSVLNRDFARNLLINLLVAAVMMSTLVVGPFYLSLGLGLEQKVVGFVMAAGPLISIFSGVPSGRLVDAKGSRPVLMIGLSLLAAGAFLLAVLPDMFGVAGYVVAIVILTPGYQLFQSANNANALTGVAKDSRGTAAGLLSLARNLGLMAGASIMGAVFAYGVGTLDLAQASPTEIAAGMRLAFLVAGGAMIAALAIASQSLRRRLLGWSGQRHHD